ncbi:MAG TPA: hypothetical protein VIM98_03145 [Dyella sp.]|uniref:hypothetical protein n=1 Tax=Dyella sp. TaxID=1869338 RepID=UPI002F920B9F
MSLITSIFHFPPTKPDKFTPAQDAASSTAGTTASGSAPSSKSNSNSILRAFQDIRNVSWSLLSSLASRCRQQSAQPDASENGVTGIRWRPRNFEATSTIAGVKPTISWPIESGRCADTLRTIINTDPANNAATPAPAEFHTAAGPIAPDDDVAFDLHSDYDGASEYWSADGDEMDSAPLNPNSAADISQKPVIGLPKPAASDSVTRVNDWLAHSASQQLRASSHSGANHLPWIDPRGPIDV